MNKVFLTSVLAVVIIALCLASVYIFIQPAVFEAFDLTNKDKIATAIAGLTSPIIGITSSILLYLAFTKQNESTTDQRIKNEYDTILSLINTLETELSQFYISFTENGTEFTFNGIQGLNKWAHRIVYNPLPHGNNGNFSLKDYYGTNQLILILRSFALVESRIDHSSLSITDRNLFNRKMATFYECRLKYPIESVLWSVDRDREIIDIKSKEITDFYIEHQIKYSFKMADSTLKLFPNQGKFFDYSQLDGQLTINKKP